MKLPEYALKKGIQIKDPNNSQQAMEFPSGTLIFPFWNETLLPSHKREELKEVNQYAKEKSIMCVIGQHWVPIPASNIRSNR